MRTFIVLILGILISLPSSAQVRVLSEPDNSFLVDVTRDWGKLTRLGDLRMKRMAEDDLEVRFWAGFGLVGTSGGVLRRSGGEWEFVRINVQQYRVADSDSLAEAEGVLPPCVLGTMGRRCQISTTRHMGSHSKSGFVTGTTYSLSCPYLYNDSRTENQEGLASLWQELLEAGIRSLPPDDEVLMLDGLSYVIEVREGNDYRASTFAHVGDPVDKSWEPYREIVQLLARRSLLWHLVEHDE